MGQLAWVDHPREVVEEEQIKEHTKMRVLLVKGGRAALKSTFGIAHGSSRIRLSG